MQNRSHKSFTSGQSVLNMPGKLFAHVTMNLHNRKFRLQFSIYEIFKQVMVLLNCDFI